MKVKGFTLIEVLTVIAIFGILVSIGGYTFSAALARSRDNQRLSDLNIIKNALEQYYLDNRSYLIWEAPEGPAPFHIARWQLGREFENECPHLKSHGGMRGNIVYLTPFYMASIPEDPIYKAVISSSTKCLLNEGSLPEERQYGQYLYASLPDTGTTNADYPAVGYMLIARLERKVGQNIFYDDESTFPWPKDQGLSFHGDRAQGILFHYEGLGMSHNYVLKSGRNN